MSQCRHSELLSWPQPTLHGGMGLVGLKQLIFFSFPYSFPLNQTWDQIFSTFYFSIPPTITHNLKATKLCTLTSCNRVGSV